MNKKISESRLIPQTELKLDYIILNYCSIDTTCFTYAYVTEGNSVVNKFVYIHCEEKTL